MTYKDRTACVAFDPREPVPPEHELAELFRLAWGAGVSDECIPWPWKADDIDIWLPVSADVNGGFRCIDMLQSITYWMLIQKAVICAYCEKPDSKSFGFAILSSKTQHSPWDTYDHVLRGRVSVINRDLCPFCVNETRSQTNA